MNSRGRPWPPSFLFVIHSRLAGQRRVENVAAFGRWWFPQMEQHEVPCGMPQPPGENRAWPGGARCMAAAPPAR
jgi:hypothetical protein